MRALRPESYRERIYGRLVHAVAMLCRLACKANQLEGDKKKERKKKRGFQGGFVQKCFFLMNVFIGNLFVL